jgi:hypothetical protein
VCIYVLPLNSGRWIRTTIARSTYHFGFHRRTNVRGLDCPFVFVITRSDSLHPVSTPSFSGLARDWHFTAFPDFEDILSVYFYTVAPILLKSRVLPLNEPGVILFCQTIQRKQSFTKNIFIFTFR